MRYVLVPLDGNRLPALIMPDAIHLVGIGGDTILVRDVVQGTDALSSGASPSDSAHVYGDAGVLGDRAATYGVSVRTETVRVHSPADAIDRAVTSYGADIVACATHGRTPVGRLVHGSVAWRAMVRSPVPFLLRHAVDDGDRGEDKVTERRIMVPLDGSEYAEKALALAEGSGREWNASVHLVQVILGMPASLRGAANRAERGAPALPLLCRGSCRHARGPFLGVK